MLLRGVLLKLIKSSYKWLFKPVDLPLTFSTVSITLSHHSHTHLYIHWPLMIVVLLVHFQAHQLVRLSAHRAHILPMAYGLFNNECCTYVILCVCVSLFDRF